MSSIPLDETKEKDMSESTDANGGNKNEEIIENPFIENCVALEKTAKDDVNQEEMPSHENTDNKHVIISPIRRMRIPLTFAELIH
jgi:hypothetical protein